MTSQVLELCEPEVSGTFNLDATRQQVALEYHSLSIDSAHEGAARQVDKASKNDVVEDELVVELKAVDELHKKHYTQVRSYLKATNKPVGLLANFADQQLDPRRVELNKHK